MRKIITFYILIFLIISTFSIQDSEFLLISSENINNSESKDSNSNVINSRVNINTNNFKSNNSVPPDESAWIINNDEKISSETKIIQKSIIIKPGGSLIINNSEIYFNSSDSPIIIFIEEGGSLLINKSSFSVSNISGDIGYNIVIYGNLIINNSELNYLCYISETCSIESCSGSRDITFYSPGIEIYSDNVKIYNSKINFARNTSIYIENANPEIFNNIFSNNTSAIAIKDSNTSLNMNKFYNNYYGVDVLNSDVLIFNSTFISTYANSISSCISGYLSNIEILNNTVKNAVSILLIQNCNIIIKNSYFNLNSGLFVYDSDIEINNSTFKQMFSFFLFYNVTGNFNNNRIEDCLENIKFENSKNVIIENNSFESCISMSAVISNCFNILIKNNKFMNNENGLLIVSSLAEITKNEFINCSLFGLTCEWSYVNITENSIKDNHYGLILSNTWGKLKNNSIIQNNEGIIYSDSNISISDNLIANNTYWGINITSGDSELINNSYSNLIEKPNGFGRIIKLISIEVHVKDLYGRYINNFRLSIFDKNTEKLISSKDVIWYGSYTTKVPEYVILNSGEKQLFQSFIIESAWGVDFDDDEKIIAREIMNIDVTSIITLNLQLPDLYVTNDDLLISDTNPKIEDTIEIEVTIHYTGLVKIENIEAKIMANNIKLKEFYLNFNGSKGIQNQTEKISWKIPKNVYGLTNIKVEISQNTIENRYLDYDQNNSVYKLIEIEESKDDISLDWSDQSSAVLCLLIILIIVLILILILFKLIKRGKKKEREYNEKLIQEAIKKEQKEMTKITKEKPKEDEKKEKNHKKTKKSNGNHGEKGEGEKKKTKSKINDTKRAKKTLKEKFAEDLTQDGPRIKW